MTEGIIIDLGTLEVEDLVALRDQINDLLGERRVAVLDWETLENNGQFVSLTRYLDKGNKIVFRITEERDITWSNDGTTGYITCLQDMKELCKDSPRIEHYYEKLRLASLKMFE